MAQRASLRESSAPKDLQPCPISTGQELSPVIYNQRTRKPKQQLSYEEWESLRPLIWRLYIRENKTYKTIAHILYQKSNFLPTKRQFTRRLAEWGFRKNMTQNERVRDPRDLSSTPEYTPPTSEGSVGEMDEPVPTPEGDSPPSTTGPLRMEVSLEGPGMQGDFEKCKSIDPWVAADVTGSPGLACLFAALRLRGLLDDEPLDLTAIPTVSISQERQSCISSSELKLIATTNEDYADSENGLPVATSNEHQVASSMQSTYADVFFPSGCQIIVRPLHGLSAFPLMRAGPERDIAPATYSISYLRAQAAHSEDLLKKLKLVCPKSHPGVIKTMRCLAHTYYDLGKDQEAERWYRQFLGTKGTIRDAKAEDLSYWLDLVHCLVGQGKYHEAEDLHQPIHSALLNFSSPPTNLLARSLAIMSGLLSKDKRLEEAEKLRREEVQLCLTVLGSEHPQSALAISRLAETMFEMDHNTESEQLFRAAAKMHVSTSGAYDARLSSTLRHLMDVLADAGRSEECEKLGQTLVERSMTFWGNEHEESMRCSYQLALVLRWRESTKGSAVLLESTNILERTLEQQIKALGRNHPDTLCTMYELGWNLLLAGQEQEATTMFEKELMGRFEAHGAASQETLWSCKELGERCYQAQGRFGDAVALWQVLLDRIESEGDGGRQSRKAAESVRKWIRDADRRKELPPGCFLLTAHVIN